MVAKNFMMLVPVSIPILCTALSYNWSLGFGIEGELLVFVLLSAVSILTLDGFFRLRRSFGGLKLMQVYVVTYLSLQILWPYASYDRFLMPLLPFLLLLSILGFAHLVGIVRRELSQGPVVNKISAAFVGLVLVFLVASSLTAYSHGLYGSVFKVRRSGVSRAIEDLEAIKWINAHTEPADVLVCYRDPTYYLYTGHKATRCSSLRKGGVTTAQPDDFDKQANTIFEIIRENGARYLISTSSDMEFESKADLYRTTYRSLLRKYPETFVPVFKSETGAVVYRIGSLESE
jgi:hypothetical protein